MIEREGREVSTIRQFFWVSTDRHFCLKVDSCCLIRELGISRVGNDRPDCQGEK